MTARFVGGMSFSTWEVFENCRARFMYAKVLKLPTADPATFSPTMEATPRIQRSTAKIFSQTERTFSIV